MFLRGASKALLPSRALLSQRQSLQRCLCSETTSDGRESTRHDVSTGTRFDAGKSILMEIFPATGEPQAADIHAARTAFYAGLRNWEGKQQRQPSEVLDILYALPNRYYPSFAQFVHDRKLLPDLSIGDVKTLVRNHPRRNAAPTALPLLNGCIARLTKEVEQLETVDAALILISLSYVGNVDYGRLLGVFTSKLLNDVESIPLKMVSSVIEMLSRKRLLDRRFSSAILSHIQENADELSLNDLLSCCSSFSYARLLSDHHLLLTNLDLRMLTEAEKLTDSMLGAAVSLFRINSFRVRHCVPVLMSSLTDPKKEAACTSRTFCLLSNYLCHYVHLDNDDVLTAIRSGIISRKTFEPKELMLVVACLSHLQLVSYNTSTSPLEEVAAVLSEHIPQLHASQLVSLLLEMRKVEVLSSRLVETILTRALETCDDMKVDDAVRLIHAAARIIRRDNPGMAIKLMWKIAPQIASHVPHMQPRILSMTCMAMNMLAVKHPLLCTAITERGYKMLTSGGVDIDTVSSIASCLSRVDFPAVDFFVELHKQLENSLIQVPSQQHLVRLAWACVAQGVVPRTTLQRRVFSIDTAPTGDEELSYLQMLRDLFIIAVYDGIFKVPAQSDVLKQLFASISAKQMQYESKPEFVSTLIEILGEPCVISGGITVESISLPAVMLFDDSDGSPIPWSKVGVVDGAMLPQAKMLKEKLNARAVALISPSVVHPEKTPSGQTKMMCRILRSSGWYPGLVPLHQWNLLKDNSAKLDLLKEILMDTLTRPEAENDT
eukprot:scpid46455/ scgid7847/ 